MVYTLTAQANSTTPHQPRVQRLETLLEAALEHARRLTDMNGTHSIETALAWETVEELRVAQTCKATPQKSAFVRYCEANPDAPECRIYDA